MTNSSACRAPDRVSPRLSLIPCLLALGAASAAGDAHALAFGALRVMSSPGQPLQAEVELLDVRETPRSARALAPSAARDRGLDRLAYEVKTDIVRLPDGRYVLRLSSSQPIAQAALQLALQVDDGEGVLARDFALSLMAATPRAMSAGTASAPAQLMPSAVQVMPAAAAPATRAAPGEAAPAVGGSAHAAPAAPLAAPLASPAPPGVRRAAQAPIPTISGEASAAVIIEAPPRPEGRRPAAVAQRRDEVEELLRPPRLDQLPPSAATATPAPAPASRPSPLPRIGVQLSSAPATPPTPEDKP